VVLKTLLLTFFLSLFSVHAQQRPNINTYHYKRMVELYEAGNLDEALKVLQTNIDLNRTDVSNDIMFLAAAIYHKSGQTKKALSTLNFLIKKRYMKEHRTALSSYSSNGNASDLGEVSKGLILLYLQKGLIYVDILRAQYAAMSERQRTTLARMIRMAVDIALEVGYKEDFADALLATLQQIEKDYKDSLISNNWFAGLHYITWRDEITLTTAAGQELKIRTTNSGLMAIVGKRWANAFQEWSLSGGYAVADATVGNDDPNINYFQSGVASSLLTASGDWHWRPNSDSIAIGLEGILAFRAGDYEDPTNSNGISDKTLITLGVLGSVKWRIEPFEFQTKFGKVLGMPSSFVSFGALYHF
tara:strand:- start:1442 stop:2518 length:1077 start_codon:yes stop_codon:yes gene_type:complete